jgi:ubiquinone/menaquinone biosynthesis C-methylase UbiE
MDNGFGFKGDPNDVYESQSGLNLTVGKHTYLINTQDKRINMTDYARLNKQNDLLNHGIGLFPDGYLPGDNHIILDVACGPAGWIRNVALAYPSIRIIGIDNNKLAIKYARENEATKHNPRVFFELADIMQKFNCPSNTFDFINMRFLIGVLPKDKWVDVLQECFRVLKPGGCIRLVELEVSLIAAPAESKIAVMIDMFLEALWTSNKSFARNAIAITPMLPAFLSAAGYSNIHLQPFLLDWSYGKELHPAVLEDFAVSMQELSGVFMKMRSMSGDQFDEVYKGFIEEASRPDHHALWPVNSAHAFKPF